MLLVMVVQALVSFFISDFDTWISTIGLAVSYKRPLLWLLLETLEKKT